MFKVTIFQTDIAWANPDENVEKVRKLFQQHTGSDLYVLPEMWATGFATIPQDIAEMYQVFDVRFIIMSSSGRYTPREQFHV